MDSNSLQIETRISKLGEQVKALAAYCEQLKLENHSLQEKQADLVKERGQLLEKNELARSRVEAMINRLKAMEQRS